MVAEDTPEKAKEADNGATATKDDRGILGSKVDPVEDKELVDGEDDEDSGDDHDDYEPCHLSWFCVDDC